ncbi:MAG: hypothetical protein MZV65_18790 [Chromatiales bacterium]|nr:hypothetical protein [Chromatiales bacterium]
MTIRSANDNTDTATNIEHPLHRQGTRELRLAPSPKSGYRNITLRPSRYYGGKPFLVATIANGKTDKLYVGSAPVDHDYSLALLVGLLQAAKHHGGDPSILVNQTRLRSATT